MTPEQLRASILQYAMEGKLVKQDPNDFSAISNLTKSRQEIEEAVKKKLLRKERYTFAEKANNIPENWVAARLKEICKKENSSIKRGPFGSSITKSMFVPKSVDTYKVYEQGNAIRRDKNYGSYYITKNKFKELESFSVKPGDIIISCAGTIGKTFILPEGIEKGIINQALLKLTLDTSIIDKKFFLIEFATISSKLNLNAKGSAIKNLASLKYLKNEVTFLLPPLTEQKRIVAKIEKLMPLVDKYAETYNRLQKIDGDFKGKLKQSILQYAMEGKLVPQNFEDESASVLLEKIKARKQELIKEGKIKKSKAFSPIADDEKPFDIPTNWVWVRIAQLLRPQENIIPDFSFKYIDIASVDNKNNIITNYKNIVFGKDKVPVRARRKINEGDILYSLVRPYLQNIAIVSKKFDDQIATSGFYDLKLIDKNINNYIFFVLLSPFLTYKMYEKMRGINSPSIKKSDLDEFLVPLPPLEEQKRIVDKIQRLFRQINKKS